MIVSIGFHYDNEYSGNKGVIKVRTTGGLTSDSFLADVTNQTVKLRNSYKSHIESIEREPLVIPMALYFDENLDETNIRGVKRWLNQDDYKPLIFEDDPNRVYYAKLDGSSNLTHNSISSGYVEFNFITNSPYAFSPIVEIEGESVSATTFESISIHNSGDKITYPRIELRMPSTSPTDVEIFNDTTGEHLQIKNNKTNEIIIIWNEYEEFETSSSLRHVYDDHIGSFISLAEDVNDLRIRGKCTYLIEYQNVLL